MENLYDICGYMQSNSGYFLSLVGLGIVFLTGKMGMHEANHARLVREVRNTLPKIDEEELKILEQSFRASKQGELARIVRTHIRSRI